MNNLNMSNEDKATLIEYTKSALSALAVLVVPVLALWASFA